MSSGLARSVQTRLVNHAHARSLDPNHVLSRYATERLLYRLSQSPDLAHVVERIAAFIGPVLTAVAQGERFSGYWPACGPWQPISSAPEGGELDV